MGDAETSGGAGPPEGVRVEQGRKRVRAYLDGRLVLDTVQPRLVWENGRYPTYYVPAADVVAALTPTGRTERSPALGDAEVCDVVTEGATAQGAARRYREPGALRDLVRVDWRAMGEWLEEDEAVYTHPRDPYARIDILASSRHVEVAVDGVSVADSRSPHLLFETGLVPRYYLPMSDVRLDLLRPSATETHCPYKGTATYWSLEVGGRTLPDVVWCYRMPVPESQKIAGLLCFYQDRVDLTVDGRRTPPGA